MNWRDLFLVARYEMKTGGRTWLFRFFALLAIVGVAVYHLLIQGAGNCYNWKLVALPCSMPLVNAYLFSLLQSFFLPFMVMDAFGREVLGGAMECITARPIGNRERVLGRSIGLFLLFVLVNAGVMLGAMVVNAGNFSPFNAWYYLFYFLTLNVPSFFFMAGLSFWLFRVIRVRYVVLLLLVVYLWYTKESLPYVFRGGLDFLGAGVPNLFSDVTGHVGLRAYLLHRLFYLAMGMGFLWFSVPREARLPNGRGEVISAYRLGVLFWVVGAFCFFVRERDAFLSRDARRSYRESFSRHAGTPGCRVSSHAIRLRQEGSSLDMESRMTVWNSGPSVLDTLVLYLNPGLKVVSVEDYGCEVPFSRDGQVLTLSRRLEKGDTARLLLRYGGKIDPRFVDLHLTDDEYENSFRGDDFFPTGRRGAFVGDDFLLLTPACAWYPVTVPPSHPEPTVLHGQEMLTRYSLTVDSPRQKVVLSQGVCYRSPGETRFEPTSSLTGISLCGGDFKSRKFETGDLRVGLCSFGNHAGMLDYYPIGNRSIKLFLKEDLYPYLEYDFSFLRWYDRKTMALYFVETPLSFFVDWNPGKYVSGQVEPGMVFLPERGFGLGMTRFVNAALDEDYRPSPHPTGKREGDKGRDLCWFLWQLFNEDYVDEVSSCPLKVRRSIPSVLHNPCNVSALFNERGLVVHSAEYPFMNMFLQVLLARREDNAMAVMSCFEGDSEVAEYMRGKTTGELLVGDNRSYNLVYRSIWLKALDLLYRLSDGVGADTLGDVLDSMYNVREREMELDEFFKELNDRLGGLCFREEVFEDWLTTRHEQFFQLQDWEEVRYRGEQRGEWWTEISGKVRNRGQSGGMVAVKGSLFHLDRTRKRSEIESKMYSTYLEAGEAKEFRFVSKGKSSGFSLNLGLAANRPMNLSLPAENRDGGMPGELSGTWTRIDPVVFKELPGVWVVDDQDAGFSFEDGKRKSLLQRWFGKKAKMRFKNYLEDYWTFSYDAEAYGDSLRMVCSKKVGDGSSTASWRVSLPEAGRYEIKAYVLRCESNGMIPPEPALNIVYHYTVAWDGGEEEVDVLLDVLEGKWRGWVSLGVFDLPAGESRVILSDKGEKGRERLGIVADAVKWEKQEE